MFLAIALTFVPSLAEIPITASQVQVLIYIIGAAVFVGGVGTFKALLDIWDKFKPNPSHDVKYASKEELKAVREEVAASEQRSKAAVADHERRQDKQREEHQKALNEIFKELRAISRAIGRVEGSHD